MRVLNFSCKVITLGLVALVLAAPSGRPLELDDGTWVRPVVCQNRRCEEGRFVRFYPTDEADGKIAAAVAPITPAFQGADALLEQRAIERENLLKTQVAESLQKLPNDLFSAEVKKALIDEMTVVIVAETKRQLDEVKISLKAELINAIDDRLSKTSGAQ